MWNIIRTISTILLWLAGVIVLLFSIFIRNKAESETPLPRLNQSNYTKKFYEQLRNNGGIVGDKINRRWLIYIYCDIVLRSELSVGFYDVDENGSPVDYHRFSPKRSLFVFMLCNSLWLNQTITYSPKSSKAIITQYESTIALLKSAYDKEQDNDKKQNIQSELEKAEAEYEEEKKYPGSLSDKWSDYIWNKWQFLKKSSFSELYTGNIDCSRSSNLNSCPLASYISRGFHEIINDYVNSKIANIYGSMSALGNSSELSDILIHSGVQNFSDYYYSTCGTPDSKSKEIYINKDQIDGGEKNYCSHPNTYKVLSNFIENSYSKTKKNTVVNYDLLLNEASQWLFLRNALMTVCTNDNRLDCSLDDFRHLVLNELMFYGLFMKFYGHFVVSSEQFGPLTLGKDKIQTQEVLDEEGRKSSVELEVATNTIQQDFKIIRNLYAKFPIHIGLVAYLEDLVNFRNSLVKLYTPIHQMYYKLRNAQTYEK